MRILVVNWQDRTNPQAGGAELHLHQIFGRIAREGHSVHLLCSAWNGSPSRVVLDEIEVHRVGSRYSFPLRARGYFDRVLRRNAYDVIVEDLNKVPLFTPRWNAGRVVALVHHLFGATSFRGESFPIAAATWLAERPLARVYRGVPFQAVSASTAEDLVQRGIRRDRIRVIFNGVDSQWLTPAPDARSNTPLFAYVGRLKRYKRVDVLIEAFALLTDPLARLDIAGSGSDRPRLERLVAARGLGDRVTFLGFVDEVEKRELMRRAWATLLASPKEGWGISNLETAACGTAVLAADSPGIRESVVDGETGFLVSMNDAAGFAAAMRGLLESPELVETLGISARRFAETLTWERSASETLTHLKEVVES